MAEPKVAAKQRYVSTQYANFKQVLRHGTEPIHDSAGRLLQPRTDSVFAVFKDYTFETEDPEVIKLIESCSAFTGRRADGEEDTIVIKRAHERCEESEEFVKLINKRGLLGALAVMKEKALEEAKAEAAAQAVDTSAIEAAKKIAAEEAVAAYKAEQEALAKAEAAKAEAAKPVVEKPKADNK